MQRFSSFDLQRHVNDVQSAAMKSPVIITHRGSDRLVMMGVEDWQKARHGGTLIQAIKTLRAAKDAIAEEGIMSVSIFGSVARGDDHEKSDIDLLITPADGVSVGGLCLVKWKQFFEELLQRDADVVVAEYLSTKVAESMVDDLIEVVRIK